MLEAALSGGAGMPCTREEVLQFMGAVCYHLAAPSVAEVALKAGAKAAGWEGIGGALSQLAAAQPKAKGKKGKQSTEGKEDKVKKPRGLTAMNIFTSYLMECAGKDSSNPKFKMPETVDADGNKQAARGGALTFAAACWRNLSESEKERFVHLIQPVLDSVNNTIATAGTRPTGAEVLETLRKHLDQHKQDKELAALVNSTVDKVHHSNGGVASPAAKATPASKSIQNGTAQKGDTDKKRKKEEKEKEKKKVKKEEVKKEPKEDKHKEKEKKKKEEKDKKAAAKKAEEEKKKKKQESSSSSDSDDSSEEDEKPSKKAASSSSDDSTSDSDDSDE